MDHQCYEQIKMYEVFHEPEDFQEVSVVQKIGQLVCPNNCSANGDCNEGMQFTNSVCAPDTIINYQRDIK